MYYVNCKIEIDDLRNCELICKYIKRKGGVILNSGSQRSFYTSWRNKLGDCTEFNFVLGAFFLKEQGVEFVKVRGFADCGNGMVKHDWLLLSDGAVFDVMSYCHDYRVVRIFDS